jgi:hypothetical protein
MNEDRVGAQVQGETELDKASPTLAREGYRTGGFPKNNG